MAFTYDIDSLSQPVNHLRFLVQDTTTPGHFLEDEEITFAAAQETNIYRVAAGLCRAIAAKVLRDVGFDDEQIDYDPETKSKTYLELAKAYDVKADEFDGSLESGTDAALNLPAISDKPPAFTRDLHFS